MRSKLFYRVAKLPKYLVLAVVVLWVLVPIYLMIVISVTPAGTTLNGFQLPNFFTLDHYQWVLFGANVIWPALTNSAIVTVGATLIALAIATPAAYALSHMRHRRIGRNIYLSFFVLRGVPPVALILPFYLIYSGSHLLNTHVGLILALVPLALPYIVWTLRVFFDAIPAEIEEAANVDGCGTWRTFFTVVLPIARPGIAATAILGALQVYVDYIIVATLAGPKTLTFPVYITGFQLDFLALVGPLAAASLIGTLPMIVMFGFSQRYMLRLATAGIH
jgi:ABC-type sugar transport system, permease component